MQFELEIFVSIILHRQNRPALACASRYSKEPVRQREHEQTQLIGDESVFQWSNFEALLSTFKFEARIKVCQTFGAGVCESVPKVGQRF